ncbi:phosphoenolpyruvate synthase, partial [bacterium]|nr:phosphoenolpyruvate synthase [bacterium]
EDLPDASFAGQQETYLNIKGEEELLEACKKCFASLFTNRAISYRHEKGFSDFKVGLSITVQKMVRSDLSSSGVMFSIDTESGFENAVIINSIYGLGENIVQGKVSPDEFYVWKKGLKENRNSIIGKSIGSKELKMIYAEDGAKIQTKDVKVSKSEQDKFSITDQEVLKLAKWACVIEDHYKKPMDMEWAKDGETGKLYIVQARPETVQSQKDRNVLEEYILEEKGELIVSGASVGSKIGSGKAHIIKDVSQITSFKKGEVLVTEMTDPDWEPIMKIASAIVTNSGGRTCHAAIISRELGIPCIVGTVDGTDKIKNNQKITVSCAEGESGKVYKNELKFSIKKTNLNKIKDTKTKVMLNIANPEIAFSTSFIPNDGVGLAREEFIINTYIRIHPKALLNFSKIKDKTVKKQIEEITKGYKSKSSFYVDKLTEGIARLGAAFYPKPVIVRFSDFKTNEYANLIGGTEYEPIEHNPMIGWRGASRYYDPEFEKEFGLECKAIKKAREEMGLDNILVMVPFCRTVEEGKKVLEIMEKYGLKRGENKLEVYMMVEIPSNVILMNEFSKIFDGFSIGSNDLTQLTLGVDRDSSLVSHVYDERNDAVKTLIKQAIEIAKKNKRKIGICGQAPSDFPDFAEFLVKNKIDSISLNPDTVIKTKLMLSKSKKVFGKK